MMMCMHMCSSPVDVLVHFFKGGAAAAAGIKNECSSCSLDLCGGNKRVKWRYPTRQASTALFRLNFKTAAAPMQIKSARQHQLIVMSPNTYFDTLSLPFDFFFLSQY